MPLAWIFGLIEDLLGPLLYDQPLVTNSGFLMILFAECNALLYL